MNTVCVILAAGEGKRMNSPLPKVLHKLYDKPMLQYVVDSVKKLGLKVIVIVGKHSEQIKSSVSDDIVYAVQQEPKGTAHALLQAESLLKGFKDDILVLNGDMPLVTTKTLRNFLKVHREKRNKLSILSFIASNPDEYGHIKRDKNGIAMAIVEDKDATKEEKLIHEVNSGTYAISKEILGAVKKIEKNRAKGEFFLTDLLKITSLQKVKSSVYCLGSEEEFMGVNTGRELIKAAGIMRQKIINGWTDRGVRFINVNSVEIHPDVRIGSGSTIYPNVCLEGKTKIGRGCTIYPNVRIKNSSVGNRVQIKDSVVIEDSIIGPLAQIGPFTHIRPESCIGTSSKIGNFVEIKKSFIGSNTKVSHLSYIGDASVGKNTNVGAGTITCNYDGKQKHKTSVGDNVFIGSDTQLVAPVKVGKGAYIGAGSTITKDVPSLALAISRTSQKNIKNWAAKRQSARPVPKLRESKAGEEKKS